MDVGNESLLSYGKVPLQEAKHSRWPWIDNFFASNYQQCTYIHICHTDGAALDFSYNLMPRPGFKPTSAELHWPGPFGGHSADWAVAAAIGYFVMRFHGNPQTLWASRQLSSSGRNTINPMSVTVTWLASKKHLRKPVLFIDVVLVLYKCKWYYRG